MKSDLYTKAVLTVIAACLLYLCIAGAATPARADGPVDCRIVEVRRSGYRWDALKVEAGK